MPLGLHKKVERFPVVLFRFSSLHSLQFVDETERNISFISIILMKVPEIVLWAKAKMEIRMKMMKRWIFISNLDEFSYLRSQNHFLLSFASFIPLHLFFVKNP